MAPSWPSSRPSSWPSSWPSCAVALAVTERQDVHDRHHDRADDEPDDGGEHGVDQPTGDGAQRPAERVVDLLLEVVDPGRTAHAGRRRRCRSRGRDSSSRLTSRMWPPTQSMAAVPTTEMTASTLGMPATSAWPTCCEAGSPLGDRWSADVVHLHHQRHEAVDSDGDEHGDHDARIDGAQPEARVGGGVRRPP